MGKSDERNALTLPDRKAPVPRAAVEERDLVLKFRRLEPLYLELSTDVLTQDRYQRGSHIPVVVVPIRLRVHINLQRGPAEVLQFVPVAPILQDPVDLSND